MLTERDQTRFDLFKTRLDLQVALLKHKHLCEEAALYKRLIEDVKRLRENQPTK